MKKGIDIESVKNKIMELQEMDQYDSAKAGFDEKKDWYNYIMVCEDDPIADEIIDYSKKNDFDLESIANLFDPEDMTMVMRVGRRLQRKINNTKGALK